MSFQPIRRILPHALQSAGISKQVNAARVVQIATEVFQRLWGEEKASYVRVTTFQDGVLTVKTPSPGAQQEIRVQQIRLQNEINRLIGARRVLSIKCFGE